MAKTMPVYQTEDPVLDFCTVCHQPAVEQGYCRKHVPLAYSRKQHKITITGESLNSALDTPVIHGLAEIAEILQNLNTPIIRHEIRETSYSVTYVGMN